MLARLGKPEDLVTEERTRIDQRWVKSRASNKEEGEAAAAAVTTPRANRPLRARRRPSSDTQPLTGQADPPGQDLYRHRPGRLRHRGRAAAPWRGAPAALRASRHRPAQRKPT